MDLSPDSSPSPDSSTTSLVCTTAVHKLNWWNRNRDPQTVVECVTANLIRDPIRIRIVTPDSIRIPFERKRPIRMSLFKGHSRDHVVDR